MVCSYRCQFQAELGIFPACHMFGNLVRSTANIRRAPVSDQGRIEEKNSERKRTRANKGEKKMDRNSKEESGFINSWVKKHLRLYTGATRHPFILSIRNGSVDLSSFKIWLGQDYVFVREFVPFVASVLIKASKSSDESDKGMEVVLAGMSSLSDEIQWFKREASKWGVPLSDIIVHKSNQNYCRFLESLMLPEVEYAVAMTAFWVIEAVYQESFAHCLEDGNRTPPELQETCQRWGNEGFGEYCRSLQKIANRCLEKAPDYVRAKAEVIFLRVLEYEVEFWNMSHGGT